MSDTSDDLQMTTMEEDNGETAPLVIGTTTFISTNPGLSPGERHSSGASAEKDNCCDGGGGHYSYGHDHVHKNGNEPSSPTELERTTTTVMTDEIISAVDQPEGGKHQEEEEEESDEIRTLRNKDAYRKLKLACLCSATFMIGEIVGGYYSNSLTIMADAAEKASDMTKLILAILSIWIAETCPSGSRMSFGYVRLEVMGAIVSVLLIWAMTAVIVVTAIQRFMEIINAEKLEKADFLERSQDVGYELVDGRIMFLVACIGLVINITLMTILGHEHHHPGSIHHHHHHHHDHDHDHEHGHHHHDNHQHRHQPQCQHHTKTEQIISNNINVDVAFIHAFSDLLKNIGVIISGGLIWVFPQWQIIDPISTFFFSALVILATIDVLFRSCNVLMEGTPEDMDHDEIERGLSALPSIEKVDNLHIWSLTVGVPTLCVHLKSNMPEEAFQEASNYLRSMGIDGPRRTIQVERLDFDLSICQSSSSSTTSSVPQNTVNRV